MALEALQRSLPWRGVRVGWQAKLYPRVCCTADHNILALSMIWGNPESELVSGHLFEQLRGVLEIGGNEPHGQGIADGRKGAKLMAVRSIVH